MGMWFRMGLALLAALVPAPASAFFEQMFGGGGGGQHFHMGGGFPGMGGMGRMPPQPKWPKGVDGEIAEEWMWLRGTTWEWNKWRNVKFEADGTFTAPTEDCTGGQCKWCAQKNKIYILWGQAGLHLARAKFMEAKEGNMLSGKRKKDRKKFKAKFVMAEEIEEDIDYYEVLGLDMDATDKAVKKAYRRMSVKYHPDKNKGKGAEEAAKQFAKVRDAYEILSDPDRRILYDTGGIESVREADTQDQQQAAGAGQMDPFAAFFGGGRQKDPNRKAKKGDDSTMDISVSLEDLYNGDSITAQINRRVVCRGCRKKKKGESEKCDSCGRCPDQIKTVQRMMGPGMMVNQQVQVKSKEKCKEEQTDLEVLIEQGMATGSKITFERMSEQTPGQIPGDVIFIVKQKRHKTFKRDGDDLHMTLTLSLKEALLGFSKEIPHLDGHKVVVANKGVTMPDEVMKVENEGMPMHNFPSERGHLYVKLRVKFPKSLSAEQTRAIKDAL